MYAYMIYGGTCSVAKTVIGYAKAIHEKKIESKVMYILLDKILMSNFKFNLYICYIYAIYHIYRRNGVFIIKKTNLICK